MPAGALVSSAPSLVNSAGRQLSLGAVSPTHSFQLSLELSLANDMLILGNPGVLCNPTPY